VSAASKGSFILDSYAILAYLGKEAGGDRVREILDQAKSKLHQVFLSLISLGEIAYLIERHRGANAARETIAIIRQLPIEVVEINQEQVFAAAHIQANYPLSYADAFVVALAELLDATVITGDPEFENLPSVVSVEMLPRES